MFVCKNCGCGFDKRGSRGPNPTYCSKKCKAWQRMGIKADQSGLLHLSCIHCGKRFESEAKRKYCSRKCREVAGRFREERQCVACSKEFTAKSRDANACSQKCAQTERWSGKPLISNRVCVGCGVHFKRYPGSRNKGLYCSRECAFRKCEYYNRPKHPVSDGMLEWVLGWKNCLVCRCDFYISKSNVRICSSECRKRQARNKASDWYNRKHGDTRPCTSCGKVISRNGNRMCNECRRAAKAEQRRASKAIRRAREKTNGLCERIKPKSVFERDGWVCQLCRDPVARNEKVPHPRAPTLDHIIPLSKGGPHTIDNVQCACFECNYIKSDSVATCGIDAN